MGVLQASTHFSRYRILDPSRTPSLDELRQKLSENSFRPIDDTADESSIGWSVFTRAEESDFSSAQLLNCGSYYVFSLRQDVRRVPGSVLRREVDKAIQSRLANSGLQRLPRADREDIKEAIRARLLSRAFPSSTVVDIVWDTSSNLVYACTVSGKILESFQDLFAATFGLELMSFYHPYAVCEKLAGAELSSELQGLNQTTSPSILELVQSNLWIGEEFGAWILHQTLAESGSFDVAVDSPLANGSFIAYVGERLVLTGESAEGSKKTVLTGPQENFQEALLAIREDKRLASLQLVIEVDEKVWSTNLDLVTFNCGGLRAPKIEVESDVEDPAAEAEASLLAKMSAYEEFYVYFESVLSAYLNQRLSGSWTEFTDAFMEKVNDI